MSIDSLIRINKYICESGLCSRKAADVFVKKGVVTINNLPAKLGDKVSSRDEVAVNGSVIKPLPANEALLIAFNKPVGVVCTAARTDSRNIVDFIDYNSRIYPIGRLDKDSQGLIFLTNKCEWVDKILGTGNQHEKEYMVTVNKNITEEFMLSMSTGVPILGVVTKSCQVVKESARVFSITLVQGLNRQIRRMCKHHNYKVEKLERTRIMHINLNSLKVGQWRALTEVELAVLQQKLDNG